MTKSTITRERLEQLANFKGAPVTRQEEQELARMALAAMDSEPVAWTDEEELRDVSRVGFGEMFSVEPITPDADMCRVIPLYLHAQPVPVVPDDVLDALQKVARIRLDMNDFDGDRRGIADCLGDAEEALIEVVNRRAAMLAADPQLPGSDPAPVPGSWIPVSERMPEVGVKVLCFPAEDEPIHATFNGQLWLQDVSWSGSEEPIDNVIPVTVTHWMPLPNPPKE